MSNMNYPQLGSNKPAASRWARLPSASYGTRERPANGSGPGQPVARLAFKTDVKISPSLS